MKQYILYLNLPDSYCQIFLPTENNRKYELELSASLDALEAQLGSRFVRTHRSFGMVTGYRFTEDEFVFLAYFYQCMTVPAWFLCEPEQIDPEKALRTLERKGMLLKNGGKNTPHPVIEYLFSQLAQACAFFGGMDRIFCYFCPQLTLAAEQSGAGVRLLPFQTPQDCFAYLRESGYAREALQPSTRQADGSIQNETEKTLWTQWEEGT